MGSPIVDLSARIAAYALFFTAIIACNGNASTNPSTSASSKPNASSSTISVDDTSGNRLQEATVTLSTGLNGMAPSGTIIGTQETGFTGQAVFNGIPSSGQVCVSARDHGYVTAGVCREPFPP